MSGHSKWATIKRAKGKNDAKRGNIFTKISREIAVAVKAGGTDPNSNARLRDVIAKAKANNIPSDNITRSIKKAGGELGAINYEPIVYEGYGPSGIAMIVECLTDNKNRTAGEVRHLYDKSGGSMGVTGSVGYLFETKGIIIAEKNSAMSADDVMMAALEGGAEDFEELEDEYEITTAPNDLGAVREACERANITVLSAEVDRIPVNSVEISGEIAEKFQKILDALEDLDDVQNVYHSAILND